MLGTTLRPTLLTIALWFALFPHSEASAQEQFDFYGRGPYRSNVPRPSDLLGYEAGQRHTQYLKQQWVLDQLIAAASDRVRTEEIGVTEEGRVMRVLLISSPENLARLDEIRTNMAGLADPRMTTPDAARSIVARDPAVVMLSYSIHGNEPAGYEAAMWVAYQLLASEEPATLEILNNTLTVLNPSANPDGHERFAVWYNSLFVGTDEPWAYEWNEPWGIWGRYSHYRFDMNRDVIALSQAPTRAMVGAVMRWHPQVFVDHHSTVEQFWFPPPALPLNPNFPSQTSRWLEVFGRGNAAAFDRYAWQYDTRGYVFDLFYTGYFDTGPSLHGATGMTYETDGGKALARRRGDGTVITFADGIAHHMVASLATLETAATNREERLRDYYAFHRAAIQDGRTGDMKRVVVLPDNDHTNAARLASLLLQHGVEVQRLSTPYTSSSARSYMAGPGAQRERRTFPPGALVIDLAQPEGTIAKAVLEPRAELDQEFVAREIGKFQRNQRRGRSATTERYNFYDLTAWSLPYTLGLDAYWTSDAGSISAVALSLPSEGDAVRALALDGVAPSQGRSGYLFANDRQASAQLAMALLQEGFVLNVSTEVVRADGGNYPRGTFVVRTNRNPETLHGRIAALAEQLGVSVAAVQSAFPDSANIGIGSPRVQPVYRPRIAVASGQGISLTSYGALWHFLERELGQPFVPVAVDDIGSMHTFSDYNVFIVPSGRAGTIRRELGERGIDRLKQWVRDGGVLIAYGGSALFPGHEDVGLSTVKALGSGDQDSEAADSLESDPGLTPPLASPSADTDRPAFIPGSIFRATLDNSHWLTRGYKQSALPVMFRGSTMLAPSERGDNPVAFVGDSLLLSGFAWPGHTERLLKETVWAATERQGRGQVVMLAGDPLFRAFWRGPARLLTNAILFGSGR